MALINYALISHEIGISKKVGQAARKALIPIFNRAKAAMIKEFENHIITRELKEGHGGVNLSATLPDGYGNLFSFIGFHVDDDPTSYILRALKSIEFPAHAYATPFAQGRPRVRRNYQPSAGSINFIYKIELPSIEDIPGTEYPDGWRDGSWVQGIEDGIPGFESYLYDENFDSYVQSRSTEALQAKDRDRNIIIIRGGIHNPTPYMSEILEHFVEDLTS